MNYTDAPPFKRPPPGESSLSGRQERLLEAYQDAGSDLHYQAEMVETDRAFDVTVADGLESFGPPT